MTLREKLLHPDCVVAVNGCWAERWNVNHEGFGVIFYDDNGNDGEVYIEPHKMKQVKHTLTVDGIVVAVYKAVPFE